MKHPIAGALLAMAILVFVPMSARADALTVNSILSAQQAGARADGIVAMVNDPANTVAMTAADLGTLRSAGVSERVIAAIWARLPEPNATVSLQPDDARLVELVRLIKSGISESIISQQVSQSGQAYNLSVNDLLYLKQNGARESTIAALMATRGGTYAAPTVAPSELVFNDLVFVKRGMFNRNKDRQGRLVLRGDAFGWEDGSNPKMNFKVQTSGLEKVWFTCEARSSENFCYQLNFKIVKGGTFRFRDGHRESGSNAAVVKVMEALRAYYPRVPISKQSVDD